MTDQDKNCPVCDGTGDAFGPENPDGLTPWLPCPSCNGTGQQQPNPLVPIDYTSDQ